MKGLENAADLQARGKAAKAARGERENRATDMIKSQYGEKTGVVEISEEEAGALDKQSTAEKIYVKNVIEVITDILKGDRKKTSMENVKKLRTILYDSVKDEHKGARPKTLDYRIDNQIKVILDGELFEKIQGNLEISKEGINVVVNKIKAELEKNMYPGYVRISDDIKTTLSELEELDEPEK